MKAIETNYKGHAFRSRLEARWAVFFNELGVAYQYEPEGYILKNGEWYLPDFFLPDIGNGYFIEVKPEMDNICKKWEVFSETSEHPVLLLGSIPYPNPIEDQSTEDPYNGPYWWINYKYGSDGPYLFCECNECGKIGIEFDGRSARIYCPCNQDSDKEYNYNSKRIVSAYKAARSARFEHNERYSD